QSLGLGRRSRFGLFDFAFVGRGRRGRGLCLLGGFVHLLLVLIGRRDLDVRGGTARLGQQEVHCGILVDAFGLVGLVAHSFYVLPLFLLFGRRFLDGGRREALLLGRRILTRLGFTELLVVILSFCCLARRSVDALVDIVHHGLD